MTTSATVRDIAPITDSPGGAARVPLPPGEPGGAVGVEGPAPHDTDQGAPAQHFGWEEVEVFDDEH